MAHVGLESESETKHVYGPRSTVSSKMNGTHFGVCCNIAECYWLVYQCLSCPEKGMRNGTTDIMWSRSASARGSGGGFQHFPVSKAKTA